MLLLLLLLFILFASVHILIVTSSRKSTTNFMLALKPNTRIRNAEKKSRVFLCVCLSVLFLNFYFSFDGLACFDILCAEFSPFRKREKNKHVCKYWFKN